MDEDFLRRKKIRIVSLALVGLCAEYVSYSMSQSQRKEKASWSTREVTALVDYLYEHHFAAGDGGNFKSAFFNNAAEAIAPYWESGPAKSGAQCRTKWMSVSCIYRLFLHPPNLLEPQLKNTWSSIQKLQNTSGMHWDNVHGANIEGDEAEKVWNDYISQKVNFRYCFIRV
jgi:hypothetical protein